MTETAGSQKIGPYRIEEKLGSGGMGTVVKAWDDRLHRWVAIKSIHGDAKISEEARERLRREARVVAGIKHPSLVQVFDILSIEDRDHIVMEYVQGEPLTSLAVDAPLAVERILEISRQVADGLQAAHAADVVHRDLKAENVLVTTDDQAKVLDFGVAKRVHRDSDDESLTAEGVVMGTSRAMSPEQADGRRVDQRSDLFSLGTLIYEMATGRHPFQCSTPMETMQKVVRHRPRSVRRLNREVPPALEALLARLLEKQPENRPATAGEVSRELSRIRDELDNPQPRPTKSAWWWAVAAAGLVLAATILTVMVLQ